jgi:aerobic carbon-monoxide dehydrogenase large subunit
MMHPAVPGGDPSRVGCTAVLAPQAGPLGLPHVLGLAATTALGGQPVPAGTWTTGVIAHDHRGEQPASGVVLGLREGPEQRDQVAGEAQLGPQLVVADRGACRRHVYEPVPEPVHAPIFSPVTRTVLGHDVRRVEDPALLTGEARFLADLRVDGLLHAVFVRSAIAHGELRSVDTADAAAMPGVVGVLSATDLDLPPQGAATLGDLARPLLATDRVRFVGEAVAVVVAESPTAAVDAAEAVVVDVEPLPVVIDPIQAASEGAPMLFPQHGTNIAAGGHHDEDDGFFDGDDVVVGARLVHQRLAPVTMEPNGALAVPETDGSLTLWASTQGVFGVRADVAAALDLPPEHVRVRAPWIGGGFGAKGGTYPEQIVVAALALRLARPVRWVETRTENLLTMTHGRAQTHEITVGARRDGTLGGIRIKGWADVGAYPVRGMFIPLVTRMMSAGVYRWRRHDVSAVSVLTNATPTGPYRGAGRPEAAALGERAVDLVATELGLDPAEVRRRSFPRPDEFPFTTATGMTYDTGDYATALDTALELVGYERWRAEQRERRDEPAAATPLLGIGIGCYVEISGMGGEFGAVAVEDDGSVVVTTGSVPHGQGHETVWAQIASATLGVPVEAVQVVHSDTARVDHGTGTFGSRSLQLGGSAVLRASEEVLAQARALAADLLEAAEDDVDVLDDGRLGVAGVPASGLSWADLATAARDRGTQLTHELDVEQGGTFPFGCHVAVVEVDRETGRVTIVDLVAVDDCGTVVNPLLAEGQVHGGLAQGIAQMLFEEVRYDPDGNPLTATLTDYAVPTAVDLPAFRTAHTVTPTPHNPLGAKGIGESGTTGSVGALWNAVVDALAPLGVRHLDPPFTPMRVWEAMQAAEPSREGSARGRPRR